MEYYFDGTMAIAESELEKKNKRHITARRRRKKKSKVVQTHHVVEEEVLGEEINLHDRQ